MIARRKKTKKQLNFTGLSPKLGYSDTPVKLKLRFKSMVENIDDYGDKVRKFRETKSGVMFGNEKPEHAAVIFNEFFRFAERRVAILCSDMSSSVFGREDVKCAMEIALRKGVQIDVLVQNQIQDSNLKQLLTKWKDSNLRICFTEADGKLSDVKENIAVMDGTAFRLEPNNAETKAFACMYDPKNAVILENQIYGHISQLTD